MRVLGKRRIGARQRAIYFVRGDMKEAKVLFFRAGKVLPEFARSLQEVERPLNIGTDEIVSSLDGAVNVALSSQVDNGPGSMGGENFAQQRKIADIATHKGVSRVVFQSRQIRGVAGVSQLVEVDHPRFFRSQQVQ